MAKRQAQVEVTLRDRASAGLKRLGGVAAGLSRSFGLVTAAATAITTVIGARFLSGAIRSAGDFEEAMRTVQAITDAAGEELQALRDAADEAGATTRFTATEAANGLEELARAGLNANASIAALNPSLQLAAGNNQSVAESALQITTALNAFGLSADQAARVSDVYTRAAQRSAQTTEQLGEAMTFVAPVARQAGIDIEQTAALVGRLADAGFRGSLGGTALRNAILQFQDPASTFRKELSALGIETDDFVEALSGLAGAGDGAEAAIRSLGLRAGPAIQAIVAGGAPALQALTEELRNSAGASQEAAAALENNLPGALRGLASAWDAARRALVEPLVDRLTEEVQGLTARIREFVQSGQVERFAGLLKDGFDTALTAVKNFIAGVDFDAVTTRIETFVDSARVKLAEFSDSSEGLRQAFTRITGGIQVFVGTIRTAFNGLGVAISGATTFATRSLEKLVGFLQVTSFGQVEWLGALKDELGLFADSFDDTTQQFQTSLGDALGQVENGFQNLTKTFVDGAGDINNALGGIETGLDQGIADPAARAEANLASLKEEMLALGSTAEQLGEQAEDTGEKIEGIGIAFEEVTGDFGNGPEKRLIPVIQRLGNLGDAAEKAGEQISESADGASTRFDGTAESAQRASRSVEDVAVAAERAGSSAAGIAGQIGGLLDDLRSLSQGANDAVEDWLSRLPQLQTVEGFFGRLSTFSKQLTEEFQRQSAAADEVIANYERTGQASAALARATTLLNNEYNLLDQQRLANLRSVISQAQEQSEQYLDSIIERNRALQEEILRTQGREEDLAALRDAERKKSIEDQIREAKIRSDFAALDALQEQLRLEKQLEDAKKVQLDQSRQSSATEAQRANELERAADAVEREGRARRETGENVQRVVIDLVARVEAGELTFSESDLARITQRIIQQIRLDRDRT